MSRTTLNPNWSLPIWVNSNTDDADNSSNQSPHLVEESPRLDELHPTNTSSPDYNYPPRGSPPSIHPNTSIYRIPIPPSTARTIGLKTDRITHPVPTPLTTPEQTRGWLADSHPAHNRPEHPQVEHDSVRKSDCEAPKTRPLPKPPCREIDGFNIPPETAVCQAARDAGLVNPQNLTEIPLNRRLLPIGLG